MQSVQSSLVQRSGAMAPGGDVESARSSTRTADSTEALGGQSSIDTMRAAARDLASGSDAEASLARLAASPGTSSLKMRLANEGVSLTDNSDVGQGKRFETIGDKLQYVFSMIMTMITSQGWGPSSPDADLTAAREARKSAAA